MKISELYSKFIEIKKDNVKANTIERYECNYNNYIKEYFKEKNIEDITINDADNFKTYLQRYTTRHKSKLSNSSINNALTVMKSMCDYAIRKGYINGNPFYKVNVPDIKKKRTALTKKGQKIFCEYLKKHPSYTNMAYLIAMYAGLRLGEIMGLKWNDIDFTSGFIHINNNLIQIKDMKTKKYKYINTSPKTDNSIRIVPIPKFLLRKLKSLNKISQSDYVISNPENGYTPTPKYVSRRFKLIMNELKFDKSICFHSLRHTYGTRAVEAGMNTKTLQMILGHSSYQITMDIYVDASIELLKDQVNKYVHEA